MVGYAGAERVVARAVLRGAARPLLGLVGAPAGLRARCARGRGGHLHGVAAHTAAPALLGEPLELVGCSVDRLQVTLVLGLLAARRDVRVPALGHPPPRQLDAPLVEWRLQLQEEQRLLEIEDRNVGHESRTVPGRAGRDEAGWTGMRSILGRR